MIKDSAINLKRNPRYEGAPDEDCIWSLLVNGYVIGTYYGGKEKSYLNPENWARKMMKKRKVAIDKNILRLKKELSSWENEKKALSNFNEK